jgi:DNA-binding transcriptional ArsR family regulator
VSPVGRPRGRSRRGAAEEATRSPEEASRSPEEATRSPFAALADPTRRRILELLGDGEQSVGTLVAALAAERPLSQPAVSQHLGVLREAALVQVRAVGTRRLYRLDPVGLEAAASWLAGITDGPGAFAQPLDALATEVARGRRVRATPQRSEAADAVAG